MENEIFYREIDGIDVNQKSCILCKICQNNCPVSAIKVNKEERIWSIDRDLCVLCLACTKICPKEALASNKPCLGNDKIRSFDNFKIKETKSVRQIHKEAVKNHTK